MKNQNNKDNMNSGIDSGTTFNRNEQSYNNQKDEALASKNFHNQSHDVNSQNTNNKNLGINNNAFSRFNPFNRKQGLNNNEQSESQNQNGNTGNEQQQERKKGLGLLPNPLDKGKDKNSVEAKAAKMMKTVKRAKIILMISGPILLVVGFVYFIILLQLSASAILDKGFDFAEGAINFMTLNGYRTTTGQIKANIDQAAGDCSDCILAGGINSYTGLDKEILYATVNNQVLIGPDVYDAEEAGESSGTLDLVKDIFIDKVKMRSFYNMKENMLGSNDDPGTMIYSLIGLTIDVTCSEDSNKAGNLAEIAKYVTSSLLKVGAVVVHEGLELGKYSIPVVQWAQITKLVTTAISYRLEGASYLDKELRSLGFAIKSTDLSVIGDLISKTAECKDAGKYAVYDTHKTNNYSLYYSYIANVYVPVVYHSIWSTLDSEQKNKIIKETWADIVDVRNAAYQANGINNYLYYNFSDDGDVVAGVSTVGSGGSFYASDIPVGTEGTSWKQFVGPWANKVLSSGTFIGSDGKSHPRTMHYKGCYITSIAILMANSGTTLLTNTFDPGVLAQTLIDNNCIYVNANDASVHCLKWSNLAPNFKQIEYVGLKGKSKSDIASIIHDYLSRGKYVMLNVNSGGHFVAVVGIENGRVVIADPGVSATPTHLDDSRYGEGTITNMRVFEA